MSPKVAYDFIVIGGGSAGFAAARAAVDLGLDVAVIEGGAEVGGLCILHGCMPSKTMIESGNRANTIRRAEEFGLHVGRLVVSGEEILDAKAAAWLRNSLNIDAASSKAEPSTSFVGWLRFPASRSQSHAHWMAVPTFPSRRSRS